jgi:hypothetical protein
MSSTKKTKHEIWKYNKLSRAYAKIINLLTQRKAIILHLSQIKMEKNLIREVETNVNFFSYIVKIERITKNKRQK